MGWIDRRQDIMKKLKATFYKAHITGKMPLSQKVIISEICMKHGASRRTALEYLTILEDIGFIGLEEGDIFLGKEAQMELDVQSKNDNS